MTISVWRARFDEKNMSAFRFLPFIFLAAIVAGCSVFPGYKTEGEAVLRYEKVELRDIPHAQDIDFEPTLTAFKRSCSSLRFCSGWKDVCKTASAVAPEGARAFFEEEFDVYKLLVETKDAFGLNAQSDSGLMTGYYEPLLYGSRVKKGVFSVPLLAPPDDLITVDLAGVYPSLKGMRLRGKIEGRKLVPYDDRAEITSKDYSKWAIAWVDDPVSAFFLQVQGSGRLVLPDGSYMRVGYADTNGRPYVAIGRWLIDQGYLDESSLSMQNIRAWAKNNPSRVKELLNQNPSYVFFAERLASTPDEGPIGAQGVPLTPLASVAVDRKYISLGTPLIVDVAQENPPLSFTRAVVAQDTGGAIKGGLRFDFFWGFGEESGEIAGQQKSQVRAWMLLPAGMKPD